MNVEIFGCGLSGKVVEVSMSMRRKTGTVPWKTISAAAAVSAAFVWIIVGAAAWNKVDFYFRSGADDAVESIGEVLSWSDAVHSAYGLYSCGTALDEVFASNERGKNQTGRFDLAKLHKISADFAYEYREQKKQLLKIPDDTDVGYRSDVLMLHELLVKWLELVTVNFDIYVNAETFYKQHPDPSMRDEYYRRYSLENKDGEFKYPDGNKRTQEYERFSAALQRTAYWCMREHGGYMLYRGCSSAEVRSDLTGFANLINERLRGDLKPALADSEFRCLELRFKHGSSFASVWYPIRKTIQEKYFLYELRNREKNNSDFIASPQPVNNRIIVRSREDKLWNTANYLALCTDNFLWTVKFNVKHRTDANKLLKWRMEQLYDRNSAEMGFYGDTFSSDVKRCRQKIAVEEFSAPSDLQNASLELCAAAKDISDVWESYRRGGSDYKTFYRDLLNKEAAFEKKHSAVIKARWDYLYAYSKGSRGYAVSSMIYDGVPASALKQLAE